MATVPWPAITSGSSNGMHKGQALLLLQLDRMLVGVGIALADQHGFAAQRAYRVDLDLGRGGRHHDHGAGAQLVRAQRHALRVVAGRRADHALGQLLGRSAAPSCCRRRAA